MLDLAIEGIKNGKMVYENDPLLLKILEKIKAKIAELKSLPIEEYSFLNFFNFIFFIYYLK